MLSDKKKKKLKKTALKKEVHNRNDIHNDKKVKVLKNDVNQ